MYAYRTPGAYFEWRDAGLPAPAPRRVDIAGFVGIAGQGPLHLPVKVESRAQFASAFGGPVAQGYLAYAVEGFFANGGRCCWVVRVADPAAECASFYLLDERGDTTLRLRAKFPGTWANRLIVKVLRTGAGFSLVLRLPGVGEEIWPSLVMEPGKPRYVCDVLNAPVGGSQWVAAENQQAGNSLPVFGGKVRRSDGTDGLDTLRRGHFSGDGAPAGQRWGLACLEEVDSVAMVAMPDIMPKLRREPAAARPAQAGCALPGPDPEPPVPLPQPAPEYPPDFSQEDIAYLQSALVGHCERLKDRMAILDVPPDRLDWQQVLNWRGGFDTSYAAAYFPWLRVSDPLEPDGSLRLVPPSGHVAGVYADVALRKGAHQAPANQVLAGVKSLAVAIDDGQHASLNDGQVNAIRACPGRGLRVMGARTLSSDASLRYVNVRRLLLMLRGTLEEYGQGLVFEPNNADLWRRVERVVAALLDRLWRAGMFDGASAEEAYSVRCDATTTPAYEQDNGRVICEVGVNLPWPAEFVIVRIGFTQAGAQWLEQGG
jgi:hypothetical protein